MLPKSRLTLALLTLYSVTSWAESIQEMSPITAKARSSNQTNLLGKRPNVTDQTIDQNTLKTRGANLGDALSTEAGIHANPFGGGASAPIIRGQETKRIKILQNNADVIDMANMSPDHAIAVDTLLAKQVEIVRGASTLLYSSGNAAGMINVIDEKIPTRMPANGYKGTLDGRFNTGADEKLASATLTVGMGNHIALQLEGLNRNANNYHVPTFERHGKQLDYVPNSFAKSTVGNAGLSWIGAQGYIGAAYSNRQDEYGLPGHSHEYDGCHGDALSPIARINKPYLILYPFLATNKDIEYSNPGLGHCGQHNHTTNNDDAKINLDLDRYDLRGEINNPVAGIKTVRFTAAHSDYHHDEIEGNQATGFFTNKATTSRLEFVHQPVFGLTGTWGIQYLTSKNSATAAPHCDINPQTGKCKTGGLTQHLLNTNNTDSYGLFGLEQYQWNNLTFEVSGRREKQTVKMDYDIAALQKKICGIFNPCKFKNDIILFNEVLSLTHPYKQDTSSYAAGIHWDITPQYRLSANLSQQERAPTAQELYTHGMHLATNSFEVGNRFLSNEKSNNLDLGLVYQGDQLDYKLGSYYYDFDNYIYLLTLNDGRGPKSIKNNQDLQLNRYMQSPAKFYGIEANMGYQVNPIYYIALFGDYVKGRLVNMPDIINTHEEPAYWNNNTEKFTYRKQPDRYTPRLPPARLGLQTNASFNEKLSGNLEYYHVFKQDKVSLHEDSTPHYNMLNLGANYQLNTLKGTDYRIYVKGNNLLNEKIFAHESFLSKIPQAGRNFTLGVNINF